MSQVAHVVQMAELWLKPGATLINVEHLTHELNKLLDGTSDKPSPDCKFIFCV